MEQICADNGISDFGCNLISGGLYLSYIIMGIAIVSVIVLPLVKSLQSPKDLLRSISGVGFLAVIFLISYVISGDEVSMSAASLGITPTGSKLIGAGLISLYIIFGFVILGLIYSSINRAIR